MRREIVKSIGQLTSGAGVNKQQVRGNVAHEAECIADGRNYSKRRSERTCWRL
jgi:hypothetical protein